jgi:hypothetical protein
MSIEQPRAFSDAKAIPEIAKIIDPTIVEPLRSKLMEAWTGSSISQKDAERYMAENEESAYTKAREILAFLKGQS